MEAPVSAPVPASKPSLGRRLQRKTTQLFSRRHNADSPPPSTAVVEERSPPRRRLSGGKTVDIRNLQSRSGRTGSAPEQFAGLPTKQPAKDVGEGELDNNDEVHEETEGERKHSASAPPKIEKESLAKNRIRLLDVGYASVVGSQDHENEDRLLLHSNADFHLFSVMDGHGGELAGKFVVQRLFSRLEAIYSPTSGFDDDEKLVNVMHELDDEFCAYARRQQDLSGVCVLAVLLFHDPATDSPQKIVLNLGDCRVILREAPEQQHSHDVLGARVIPLSTDHCASNPGEKMRIVQNGGYVRYGRVAGLLEPSRSIGDTDMKEPEMKNWVLSTPDVRRSDLAVGRSLLILATDGVWSALTNDRAMTVALDAMRAKRRKGVGAAESAVRAVVEAARGRGSIDDITVIVVVV